MKKRFLFEAMVKAAEGSQIFYVDAETEEAAQEIIDNGGGEIYAHEVEVTDLGIFGCVGEVDLDDCGDFAPPAEHQHADFEEWLNSIEYDVAERIRDDQNRYSLAQEAFEAGRAVK